MPERIRVLVVEDLEDDLELLLIALRQGGYDVTHERVQTAEAMRAALRQRTWDIVVSDYSLPTFGAIEALGVLKESGQDLPFIVVSGTIGEENAVEALRLGAHDFVVKQQMARLVPAMRRELREAEGRRRRRTAESELARSEALLRSILDTVPEGVMVADERGRVLVWNAAADELVGRGPTTRPPEEWPAEYDFTLEDQVTPHPWETLPIVRALQGESVDAHVVYLRRESKRSGVLLSCNARPLADAQGIVHGAVAVLRDITLERAAQEQLLLSDRMASVGLLAAGVAHEINNPLSAVIANLDLLHETLVDTPPAGDPRWQELREQLSDAREAADRVRRIVKDLKVLSRSEETKTTRVDVRELLDASLRMAHNEIRHRARVTRSFRAVPVVAANSSRLGQVFLNLLINAAQAIRPGHADENHIVVATDTDEQGRAVIEVRDTGAGIPPEVKQRIFTPFFTTKPIGVGTGLGLSICHRIVTQLGGEIEVESEVGVGSTFRVLLPADPAAVADAPAPEPRPASSPVRRGRVLVIDDEEMVLSAVRRTLASEHEVVTTSESPAALARIEAGERFDVILCDLMMPVMNGIDLFAAIGRAAPDLIGKVVFFTGGAFTDETRAFLETVENVALEKPFEPQQLRALVNARVR